MNRKLSTVSAFYQHAARHSVDLGELMIAWQPAGRRGTAWKPFLHHVSKGQAQDRLGVAPVIEEMLPAEPKAEARTTLKNPGRRRPPAVQQ